MTRGTNLPDSPNNGTTCTSDKSQQWRTIRFDVLEKIEHLPSLSNVVTEFLDLAGREHFSAKDFEKVISKDQALVARLLKVANSGLYGRARGINSIPEAVVLIGLESLKKIVYAVSAEGLVRRELANYDFHSEQGFWIHSLAIGHTTRVLADASPQCPLRGDEAFVAGILHDSGKLVIDEFLETGPNRPVSINEEVTAVGMNHAELAEHILKQWGLPESITHAVRHHHDYCDHDEWFPDAATLALAQNICAAWGVGRETPLDLSREVDVTEFIPLMGRLGIRESKWEQLVWDIRQNLVGLENVFAQT
jgi:HD-like signal output (HDOD) protein